MDNEQKILKLLDKLVYTMEDIEEIWENNEEIGTVLKKEYPSFDELNTFKSLRAQMDTWRWDVFHDLH